MKFIFKITLVFTLNENMYEQHYEKEKELKIYNRCTQIHLMEEVTRRKKKYRSEFKVCDEQIVEGANI